MKLKQLFTIPTITILLSLQLTACTDLIENRLYQQQSEYTFEDTLLNLDIAIAEHNYRIIHRSHIGKAVRDRGETDFPLSTITSFCNITYAREMMDINPDLINDMPCNIAVREENSGVIVSTKLMQTNTPYPRQNKFASKINTNLTSIIEATVE
ncbi:hypothetical protein A9Q78_11545 [Methylophaga sp. 41_12_T18]|nr:hypothetical protein A9Q78_11545 [Methylophaga sp. 41_12_T18]